MKVPTMHQRRLAEALVRHSSSDGTGIQIDDALDRCRVFDVKQIAWELEQAGIQVSPRALLAMALSRAVVRELSDRYASMERAKKVGVTVTRTGDKQAA